MIPLRFGLDDGSLFVILFLLGCIGIALLGMSERYFNLPHALHTWAAAGGIVVGLSVFLLTVWLRSPRENIDLIERLGAAVVCGLLTAIALSFVIPVVVFLYRFVLRPCAGAFNRPAQRTTKQDRGEVAARRRREDARARCDILYGLHAPELGERFTRQMFDDFVSRYMGDASEPEDVERWAKQLEDILRQHLEKIAPTPKSRSIEELAQWYQDTKRMIESLPIEDRKKKAQVAELNLRYAELMSTHLETLEP